MHFKMPSAICFNLDQSKIMSSRNWLYDARMMISLLDRVEDTVGKGENAGHQCFSRPF